MATVVTSIGSNSSIDTETPSSCSGSYSPYDVTFSTDPTGVSVGDRVEITDEGFYWATFVYRVTAISGSTYTLAYVTDDAAMGAASPCDLVDGSYSQAPATFKRFYSSITNWEAGLDDWDVYGSGDIAVGECHNDSVFAETVTINGGGTVGLASVRLSVHSGSRHDGTAGTGARIVPTSTPSGVGIVNIYRDDVTVEWLEISGASATSNGNVGVRITSDADSSIFIRNNIIHEMNDASTFSVGIYDAGGGGTSRHVMNNFIYNINRSAGDSLGIYAYTSSGFGIYCNTVFNVSSDTDDASGIYVRNSTSGIAKDNISLSVTGGGTGSCFDIGTGSANAASDYNLSDDATAWGSNSVTSADGATAANTITATTGTIDLHLKSGSYAIGAGVDLGTTPTGVEIDIDGRNRDTEGDTWDIGADQTLATGVTISPATAAFELAGVSPSVVQSSLTITVAVAAFALAGITPTTVNGSISLSPTAAAFDLAAVSPSVIVPTGETVTPAAASFELAGVSPTVVAGSLSVTTSVAAVEFAGVSPSVQLSSISVTPSASAFDLAGISPTVSISSASITPSVAVVEFAGISPSVLLSSLSVTPSASAFELAAVDPTVGLSSLTVDPGTSAVEFAGVSPSTILGVLSITPTVAAFEFAAVSPSVTRGSVSVTPAAAITNYNATYGSVIAGGITVIPVSPAQFGYTAIDPTVGMSSQTVTVTASAFELEGVTPSTINGSITVSPAASVVEFAASVATIHAGVEVTPAVAAFEYIVGSFTLRVEMDSASLGYACDGLLDYIAGTIPTDYTTGKNLDYRYDHQS